MKKISGLMMAAILISAVPAGFGVSFGRGRRSDAMNPDKIGIWKKMNGPAPVEPRALIGSLRSGNKLIIWGGLKDQFCYDGGVYDPAKDTWEKIPEAPLKGEHPKELYSYEIFGYNPPPPGLAGDKLVVWSMHCRAVYDLARKAWTEMEAGPLEGRDDHVSLLYDRTLLIWGGRDDKGAQADGAVYEILR